MIKKIIKDRDSIIALVLAFLVLWYSIFFPVIYYYKAVTIAVIFIIYDLIKNKKNVWDTRVQILVLASTSMALIDVHLGDTSTLRYIFIWTAAYLLGKHFLNVEDSGKIGRRILLMLFAMGFGLYLKTMACYLKGIVTGDAPRNEWASWPEWCTNQDTSRSLYAIGFTIVSSMIIYAILQLKKSKRYFALIVLLNIGTIIAEFILGQGRLNAVLMILTTGIAGFIYLTKEGTIRKFYESKVIKVVIISLIVAIVLIKIAISLNIFGIGKIYMDSFLARDGGILNNVRFATIKEALQLSIENPFGGWPFDLPKAGIPVHNVWLLMSWNYDTIIFSILVIFLFMTIWDLVSVIKSKNLLLEDYLLISSYMAINLYFCMETGPWRYRNYWVFLLVIDGMVRRRAEQLRNNME